MKNMFRRTLALVLMLVMVLSLVACGTSDEPEQKDTQPTSAATEGAEVNATTSGEFDPRSITEGVTLTIVVEADDEVIDWETNLTTLKIEEEFGVDLKFEVYPTGTFGDKLNVMIQGGDELPDIIFGSGAKGLNSYQAIWTSTGAILPLNEYYENPDYAKYINIAIGREGDFVSTMKDADGTIWALPKYYPSLSEMGANHLWINVEYAKALGFDELPTTTEEFFELCKAFVAAGDMNGNGLDDEVIFTGKSDVDENWFKYLMSPFVYMHDDKRLDVENGKLSFAYATDGYKEGLKYIKQFFDEGLLDTTILTQDSAAQNIIKNSAEAVALADFDFNPPVKGATTLETMQLRTKYSAIPALEGPSGRVEGYWSDPVAYPGAMITADCENPDAAFIVLDYMMSQELSIMQRWGLEGEDWDWWDNVDDSKFIDGTTKDMYARESGDGAPDFVSYTSSKYWGTGTPQNKGYMLAGPGIQFTGGCGRALVGGKTEEAKLTAQYMSYYFLEMTPAIESVKPEERIITLPMTAEENESIAEIQKVVNNYWMEAGAKFVTGVWDIDEYWDTYISELEKIGMNDLLAVYQTAYDRTK